VEGAEKNMAEAEGRAVEAEKKATQAEGRVLRSRRL